MAIRNRERYLFISRRPFVWYTINQVWLGVWDGYDAKNNLPYWGFQLENYKKSEIPDLLESIKKLIEKSNIKHYQTDEKDFIAWCTTNKGVSRFQSLYEAAKESGML
ncbi:hypothetical protein J5A58_04100 [Prevotella melaninogenica]|uniref:Uncharacterized protein n=1 Tax=Prevotella melaninogenica TaxID=28132 RepID=A0ABX7XS43_9BACT|nr:hypothetical protein [Prevotella melaninogenica]QUB76230.1 hypothetical protein J5A58_04100 [Prevotella melaninogenica]